MRKLPIGIQNFEKMRKGGFIYVDKTDYIHRLVLEGAPYFLSRPRRFGKSLFLSTLKAYFEGKRELFEGLKIAELERDDPHAFEPYPVFYIDFNRANYMAEGALEGVLADHLSEWEEIYGDKYREESLEGRFQHLIKLACEQVGRQCVVLVDEYDKPLLETMDDEKLNDHNRSVFKGFFSALKSYDEYLKFVFITGVTRFGKVSIFSDLNHLNDISMDADYSGICGITDKELCLCFCDEIKAMAQGNAISQEECLDRLKKMYDGYHFSKDCSGVYNPFSLLNAFSKKDFSAYWFATGTPTFLLDRLEKAGFDAKIITEGNLYADGYELADYRVENPNPVPLLYQTGYLTIKGFDRETATYDLGYPNDEVKYGFLKSLVPYFIHDEDSGNPLDIRSFLRDVRSGKSLQLKERFTALFARLPYTEDEKWVERDFQNVIYIVFMLLGQFVHTQIHSSKGRADCIVETKDYVYIFEFKRDKSAAEALSQIDDTGYARPYAADSRKVIKIGVNFNSEKRCLDRWEVKNNLN